MDKKIYERNTIYEKIIKPTLDRLLAFGGLILLSPVYAIISISIYVDDPGPVFFTQKRVGKDKHFFILHKFRSMKMSAPYDVPTHLLSNPEQYITRVGRVLRKTSLDELPQIWDIFRGKMSIIGPRPALWNQEDLVRERDKYGANNIFPGLTGLAQIEGRDELEISEKARIDGKYTKILKSGGLKAVHQDLICFFRTFGSVLKHEGVIEGGTGSIYTADYSDPGFDDYGYKKTFCIDKTVKKKVLITGANSYIGESFLAYTNEHYPNISIHTVDMKSDLWRKHDFSIYDTVFHVAGIAHIDIRNVSSEKKKEYYKINTDLAIETAKAAKSAGVKQFIFMSSMSIYGKDEIIDECTLPKPDNFYGDSKWKADVGVRKLASDSFRVAVLRPPLVYGKGAKGNYPVLSNLAKRVPVFPDVNNKKSMIYIENLCEFIDMLVLSSEGGIYFPQNAEFTNTSWLVSQISNQSNRFIWITKYLNPIVILVLHFPGKIGDLAKKAFRNSVYSQKLSIYGGIEYQIISLKKSIELTEIE